MFKAILVAGIWLIAWPVVIPYILVKAMFTKRTHHAYHHKSHMWAHAMRMHSSHTNYNAPTHNQTRRMM